MRGQMIDFTNNGDGFEGYFSPASDGKGPGVIVVQEWWGLVGHIKDVADRFAEAGFSALAPDLFRGKTTDEPDEAGTLMQALNIQQTEVIFRSAIRALLDRPETEGDRVGVVGFCMGGQLALFAAATNPAVAACVDFYGIHPKVEPPLENLRGPVLGIFAEHDDYATPERVEQLDRQLTEHGKPHEFVTYPGTHHAFFNDQRPEVYDAEASRDAWERVIRFLNDSLRQKATL